MNDLRIDDPCLVFALNRESKSFRREFPPQQGFPGAPCWARFCGPAWLSVLVLHSGVGAERMQKVMDWLSRKPELGKVPYQPKVILSAGFAGALQEDFKVGDVILATEVVDSKGQNWPTTWPGVLPPGPWQPPLHRGRLLTTSKLVGKPEDKLALGKQFDAVAVDMESAVLARTCAQKEIPFGCVRVVSDDVQTALSPKLVSLLSGGNVSGLRISLTLLTAPGLMGELSRLAKQTHLARQQLGKALGELLTLTLPWSEELDRN